MRIADFYGWPLYVEWRPQEELPMALSDLFGDELPFHVGLPDDFDRSYEFYPRDGQGELVRPPKADGRSGRDICLMGYDYYGHHMDERTPAYEGCHDPFLRELGQYFKSLPLAPAIRKRLEEFDRRLDYPSTLGVHIRRGVKNSIYTESDKGRDIITLAMYREAIDIELQLNPHLRHIYIASNDEDTRRFFLDRYASRMTTNEQAGCGWHTVRELQEAFVEMIVLSRCARIIRQRGTTFSHFASVINRAPVSDIVYQDAPGLIRWDWPEA